MINVLFIGRKKEGPIDDSNIATCVVLKPFAHDELNNSNDRYYEYQQESSLNSVEVYNRSANICLVYGGFLCPYNDINDDGSWKCIFCSSINPAFELSTSPSLSKLLLKVWMHLYTRLQLVFNSMKK